MSDVGSNSANNQQYQPDWARIARAYLCQFDVLLTWLLVIGIVAAFFYGISAGAKISDDRGKEPVAVAAPKGIPSGAGTSAKAAAPVAVSRGQAVQEEPSAVAALRGGLAALAIAGAAGALGALTGFLFGLPRTLTSNELRGVRASPDDLPGGGGGGAGGQGKSPDDHGGAAATPASANAPPSPRSSYTDVNTNLEQISDWLTQIIVGVGLTELRTVPQRLDAFGSRVAEYFTYGGHIYAVGGGLYFLILGFFLGYVGTRVRLSLVFTYSQRANDQVADGKDPDNPTDLAVRASPGGATASTLGAGLSRAEAATSAHGVQAPQPAGTLNAASVRAADEIILSKSVAELTTNEQLRARANALARTGQPRAALDLYRDLMRRTTDLSPDFLLDYAQVLALAGSVEEGRKFAEMALLLPGPSVDKQQVDKAIDLAELRGEALAGLYENGGKTYKQSIDAIEQLVRIPEQDADPWIHTWRACAYAQRFAKTPDDAANAADREKDRERVRNAVRRAVALDMSFKTYLASLYFPSRIVNGEDDLLPLHPDEVLTGVLGPESEASAT